MSTLQDASGLFDLGLVRVSIPLLFALAASVGLRRASAATRRAVWVATVVMVLSLPLVARLSPSLPVPIYSGLALQGSDPVTAGMPSGPRSYPLTPSYALVSESSGPAVEVGFVAISVWGIGTVLLLGLLGRDLHRVRRLVRSSEGFESDTLEIQILGRAQKRLGVAGRCVRLQRSLIAPVPFTTGFCTPVIVVPVSSQGWDRSRWRSVLLHELGHISRNDYLVHLAYQVACALYWPNPLVWIAALLARGEQEKAADDLVMRAGVPAISYAGDLLAIARGDHYSVSVLAAAGGALKARMLAILDPTRSRRPASSACRVGVTSSATCICLLVGAGQPYDPGRFPPVTAFTTRALVAAKPDEAFAFLAVTRSVPGKDSVIRVMLYDESAAERRLAARSLRPNAERLVPSLVASFADTCHGNRWRAARALRDIAHPIAGTPIAHQLTSDPHPAVQAMLANALAVIGEDGPRALQRVAGGISEQRLHLIRAALSTVGQGPQRGRLEQVLAEGFRVTPASPFTLRME